MMTTANSSDRVAVTVEHKELDRSIYINRKCRDFNFQDFAYDIFQVTQSNNVFTLDGVLDVRVAIIEAGEGHAPINQRAPKTIAEEIAGMKSICVIRNTSHKCGFLALALAILPIENKPSFDCLPEVKRRFELDLKILKRVNSKKLEEEADRLYQRVEIDPSSPLDLDLLLLLEEMLPQY